MGYSMIFIDEEIEIESDPSLLSKWQLRFTTQVSGRKDSINHIKWAENTKELWEHTLIIFIIGTTPFLIGNIVDAI